MVWKELIFNSFYIRRGIVILKELILTVSTLGVNGGLKELILTVSTLRGCGGLQITDF